MDTRIKRWYFVCHPESHEPCHVGAFRTKKAALAYKKGYPSLAGHNVVVGLLYVPRKRK